MIVMGYWDPSWQLYGLPLIQKHRKARLTIGKNWIACSNPWYNSLGVFQQVILKVRNPNAELLIEEDVGISGATISCSNRIRIGKGTLIGSGVIITDTDAHPINPFLRQDDTFIRSAPVLIGEHVFIGARAIILKGAIIGDGCVIGAGSVVTGRVPPMSIVAGNPARVVGSVLDEKYLEHA